MLLTLLSTFTLLIGSLFGSSSLETVRDLHTAQERVTFLVDKLAPFAIQAQQLNLEIQALSEQIQALSPETDGEQIVALTETTTQKMEKLQAMLPILNLAETVDEDFRELDAILHQAGPLSPKQEEVVNRITLLSSSIDAFQ